jgi:hypothetical protein
MNRRRGIPLLQLALLTVLAVGAIGLALKEAPPIDNVTALNATAATFGSPVGSESFTMDLTYTVSSGKGGGVLRQVRRIAYVAPDRMIVAQLKPSLKLLGTVTTTQIDPTIDGYAKVTKGTTAWASHGSELTRTESLATFTRRVAASSSPHGTVHELAVIRNGQLDYVHLIVRIPQQSTADGRSVAKELIGETLQLRSIGGHRVPLGAS